MLHRRQFLSLLTVPLSLPNKTLFIGDSLVWGMRGLLSDHGFLVEARGGSSANDWVKEGWAERAVERHRPERVAVILGVNDAGVPAIKEKFVRNAAAIASVIRQAQARCLWLTPPKIKMNTDFIAQAKDVVDEFFDYRDLSVHLEEDGIHPSFLGNKTWFNQIKQDLK